MAIALQESLNEGIKAHGEGRVDDASSFYWTALSADLDNTDALYLNALLSFEQGKTELSYALLMRLLEQKAEHALGLVLLAKFLMASREYQQALQILTAQVFSNLPVEDVFICQSQCYRQLQQFNKAQRALRQGRKHLGLTPLLAMEFGHLYTLAGKPDRACRYFDALTSVEGFEFEARLNLGKCLQTQDQHQDALNQFNVLIHHQNSIPKELAKEALRCMSVSFQAVGLMDMALECQELTLVC